MRKPIAVSIAALLSLIFLPAAHGQEEPFGLDFHGRWTATAELGPATLFVQMDSQPRSDGSSLAVTVPAMGVFGGEPSELSRDGGAVVFTVRAIGAAIQVRVEPVAGLSDKLVAELALIEGPPAITRLPPAPLIFSRQPILMDLDDTEQFYGALKIPNGSTLKMSFRLAEVDGIPHATIDIPQQGIESLVVGCTRDEDILTLAIPVPSPARMDLTRKDGAYSGSFAQSGLNLPITFTQGVVEVVVNTKAKRPQEPELPFPYDVANLRVPTRDGHELAGTLFVPRSVPKEGVPIVVLVTGSGPQDRDETLMDHKPFLVLADRLARQGIASFRYDDRGVGESGGNFESALTQDFAHDAAAALLHLSQDPRLDVSRNGVIGHSEGAIVAAIVGAGDAPDYQDMARPRFVVMLAGPGVPGHEILREQLKLLMLAEGIDEEPVQKIGAAQELLLDAVISGADQQTLIARALTLQDLQLELKNQGLVLDEVERAQLAELAVQQLKSPWMASFLTYDPRDALKKLDMPVLAVNGTLDTQVWYKQNLPEIKRAVQEAGGEITIMEMEGLNHLLQPAKTGAVSEYSIIETTMDEATMAAICKWILDIEAGTR